MWYIVEIYISWGFQIEKNIFLEYANFMQINPPTGGYLSLKLK